MDQIFNGRMPPIDWRPLAIGISISPFCWRVGYNRNGRTHHYNIGPLTVSWRTPEIEDETF